MVLDRMDVTLTLREQSRCSYRRLLHHIYIEDLQRYHRISYKSPFIVRVRCRDLGRYWRCWSASIEVERPRRVTWPCLVELDHVFGCLYQRVKFGPFGLLLRNHSRANSSFRHHHPTTQPSHRAHSLGINPAMAHANSRMTREMLERMKRVDIQKICKVL